MLEIPIDNEPINQLVYVHNVLFRQTNYLSKYDPLLFRWSTDVLVSVIFCWRQGRWEIWCQRLQDSDRWLEKKKEKEMLSRSAGNEWNSVDLEKKTFQHITRCITMSDVKLSILWVNFNKFDFNHYWCKAFHFQTISNAVSVLVHYDVCYYLLL